MQTAEAGDQELVNAFVEDHDVEAFAVLVERHGMLVTGVCQRVLGPGPDAVFLLLARRTRTSHLRTPGPLEKGLHAVFVPLVFVVFLPLTLVALCTGSRRRQVAWSAAPEWHHFACLFVAGARRRAPSRPLLERLAVALAVRTRRHREDPWPRMRARFDKVIAGFPPRFRDPLIRVHLEGRSLEATAQALDRPVDSMDADLRRARRWLCAKCGAGGRLDEGTLVRHLDEELQAAAVPAARVAAIARAAVAFAHGSTPAASPGALALAQAHLRSIASIQRVTWPVGLLCLVWSLTMPTMAITSVVSATRAAARVSAALPPPAPLTDAALGDQDWSVRLAALQARALRDGTIPPAPAAALAHDPIWTVRTAFVGALPDLQLAPPAVIAYLTAGLADPQWPVRAAAAEAVGEIGAPAIGLLPTVRRLCEDPLVAHAARFAVQRLAPVPAAPLTTQMAARTAELVRQLGPRWTVREGAPGLILVAAPGLPAGAPATALAAYAQARRTLAWVLPADQPLTRPLGLVLVDGSAAIAHGVPELGLTGNGYDPDQGLGLADPHQSGSIAWVVAAALLHQDAGWDERGLVEGITIPRWFQEGIQAAGTSISVTFGGNTRVADLRHEQLLIWLAHAGLSRGATIAALETGVPARMPAPSLAWLCGLDDAGYAASLTAPDQPACSLGCVLTRFLIDRQAVVECYHTLRRNLARHRSRTVRAWATPGAAATALTAATGSSLAGLQRQLVHWVVAGEPAAPAAAHPQGASF